MLPDIDWTKHTFSLSLSRLSTLSRPPPTQKRPICGRDASLLRLPSPLASSPHLGHQPPVGLVVWCLFAAYYFHDSASITVKWRLLTTQTNENKLVLDTNLFDDKGAASNVLQWDKRVCL